MHVLIQILEDFYQLQGRNRVKGKSKKSVHSWLSNDNTAATTYHQSFSQKILFAQALEETQEVFHCLVITPNLSVIQE